MAIRFFEICLAGLCTCVCAQETIHYASIAGIVTDSSGAAVEGASLTARQTETNLKTAARTDAAGRFRFGYLKVGPYEVRVRQPGFADFTAEATLTIGAAFELPVRLAVASAETNVVVSGEAAVVETARSQIAGTIGTAELRSVPLNGRDYLDLALLIPGVSPANTGSNQLFAETSAAPGQGISIASQRNFSNSFLVDGLSANDDAAGLSGMFYGMEVVQEFQVVTSGGQAELGRALGGYVSMVTKSGTNDLHGDVYGYFRNQRLNAANPLSHSKLPSTQAQYGASLDGPLRRDRSFYFANLERRDLNQSGLTSIAPESVAAINARLDAVGYGGARIATGLYPNPVHSDNALVKADHQFSTRDQFSARYSGYEVESANSRGAGGLSAATASAGLTDHDRTVALGNVASFSTRTVNETRAQFTYSNLAAPPSDPAGPAVAISGIATFGTLSGSPTRRLDRLFEIVDNVSHQAGGHALRAGVDWLYNDLEIEFPRAIRGSYSFSSLANFLSGVYNNSGFTQTFGNTTVAQTNPNVGMFVQDEWKVNSRLTLNVGVRYDLQFLRSIALDTDNISPRAGFAWSPGHPGRTVIRGGFGLFYDRVPLRALANALLSSGNTTSLTSATQASVSLSPAQTGAPQFPNILSSLPGGATVNFLTMQRNMQNAYAQQANVEVERQICRQSTLSVSYQRVRGLHLIAAINRNAPACAASGGNNGCRPDASYGNNSQYSAAGDSHYDGLQVSWIQRPAKWGRYRLAYSYSKALDNVGEFFFSAPIDNRDIWQDYARSDDDQRHRLSADGSLEAYRFRLTTMLQYYSTLPLNITTGANTVQGTVARPIVNEAFLPRNAGSGSDYFNINARLSRTFALGERVKLEAIAEAFNVLNHRNNLTKNGVFGTGPYPAAPVATFGQVTAVNDARVGQIALRVSF